MVHTVMYLLRVSNMLLCVPVCAVLFVLRFVFFVTFQWFKCGVSALGGIKNTFRSPLTANFGGWAIDSPQTFLGEAEKGTIVAKTLATRVFSTELSSPLFYTEYLRNSPIIRARVSCGMHERGGEPGTLGRESRRKPLYFGFSPPFDNTCNI
ncbi:unnamed protein product [Ectocarpus sp. 8 AP-2014]